MSKEEEYAVIGRLVSENADAQKTVGVMRANLMALSGRLTTAGGQLSGIGQGLATYPDTEAVVKAIPSADEVAAALGELREATARAASLAQQVKTLGL